MEEKTFKRKIKSAFSARFAFTLRLKPCLTLKCAINLRLIYQKYAVGTLLQPTCSILSKAQPAHVVNKVVESCGDDEKGILWTSVRWKAVFQCCSV